MYNDMKSCEPGKLLQECLIITDKAISCSSFYDQITDDDRKHQNVKISIISLCIYHISKLYCDDTMKKIMDIYSLLIRELEAHKRVSYLKADDEIIQIKANLKKIKKIEDKYKDAENCLALVIMEQSEELLSRCGATYLKTDINIITVLIIDMYEKILKRQFNYI